jgi:hypothetical protein
MKNEKIILFVYGVKENQIIYHLSFIDGCVLLSDQSHTESEDFRLLEVQSLVLSIFSHASIWLATDR